MYQILHVNLRFFLIAFSFNDFVVATNRIPDILRNDGTLVESNIILTTKYTCIIIMSLNLISFNRLDNGHYHPAQYNDGTSIRILVLSEI